MARLNPFEIEARSTRDLLAGSTSIEIATGSFTRDFEGRLTGQTGAGAKTLGWDAKGRVKTVGSETSVYDPLDYRIGRSGGTLGARDYFLEGEHLSGRPASACATNLAACLWKNRALSGYRPAKPKLGFNDLQPFCKTSHTAVRAGVANSDSGLGGFSA